MKDEAPQNRTEWIPRPSFPKQARPLLIAGRAAMKGGAREEGLALLRAACALDPSFYCRAWGLMPLLHREERDRLRPRMLERLQSWYRPPYSQIHAHVSQLTQKTAMRAYISELGLPLPQLYQQAETIEALDWENLPDQLVVKPQNGSSSEGVIVAGAGRDHVAGADLSPDLRHYAQSLYQSRFERAPSVLVEELLVDVDAATDPSLVIPRDFKVHVVAGDVGFIRVLDRNAPGGKRSAVSLDREGRRLGPMLRGWPEAEGFTLPQGFGQMIAMAEYLSQRLPWLLRLDFYLTPRGPVFGEFTTFPSAGLNYTPWGRRTMLQMWEAWPD